jgi:hypothetical protein
VWLLLVSQTERNDITYDKKKRDEIAAETAAREYRNFYERYNRVVRALTTIAVLLQAENHHSGQPSPS